MPVKERRRQLREIALDRFGNKCLLCNFSKYKSALNFHHVYNDGKNDRHRPIKRYKDIIANPDRYRLLCANCHSAITHSEISDCLLNAVLPQSKRLESPHDS